MNLRKYFEANHETRSWHRKQTRQIDSKPMPIGNHPLLRPMKWCPSKILITR